MPESLKCAPEDTEKQAGHVVFTSNPFAALSRRQSISTAMVDELNAENHQQLLCRVVRRMEDIHKELELIYHAQSQGSAPEEGHHSYSWARRGFDIGWIVAIIVVVILWAINHFGIQSQT